MPIEITLINEELEVLIQLHESIADDPDGCEHEEAKIRRQRAAAFRSLLKEEV